MEKDELREKLNEDKEEFLIDMQDSIEYYNIENNENALRKELGKTIARFKRKRIQDKDEAGLLEIELAIACVQSYKTTQDGGGDVTKPIWTFVCVAVIACVSFIPR